jgi:hypothetical protein
LMADSISESLPLYSARWPQMLQPMIIIVVGMCFSR